MSVIVFYYFLLEQIKQERASGMYLKLKTVLKLTLYQVNGLIKLIDNEGTWTLIFWTYVFELKGVFLESNRCSRINHKLYFFEG